MDMLCGSAIAIARSRLRRARLYVDEAHHIHHWADGGQTTLENLTLLCGKHHQMLH